MFLYNSIYEYGEAEYIVEKSRFIAHAMPVESLEEAKAWAEDDPYWHQGVYQKGTGIVKPFKITAKMNGASF